MLLRNVANPWMRSWRKEENEHGREIKNQSPIGAIPKQKATVEALGLKKLNKTVEMPDNEAVRGMIWHVRHLVKVEEI